MVKKISTGDYSMKSDDGNTSTVGGEKMLVNIGEHRKAWVQKVAALSTDGNMTEVLRCVLDQAATEDPETYAVRVQKWRLKTQLDDIERREKELAEEKQRLVDSLDRSDSDGARNVNV